MQHREQTIYSTKTRLVIIFLISLIVLISSHQINRVYAEEDSLDTSTKVILIILDRINIEDLQGDYPHVQKLIENGALGLMNVRTAGRYRPASGYLTMGAGTRGVAPDSGDLVLQADEKLQGINSANVFENYTGINGKLQNIFVLNISEILAENMEQDFEAVPGFLAETLKDNQIPVTLLGNADIPAGKDRLGGLIAMDTTGIVEQGTIGEALVVNDEKAPFFVKTDYDLLYREFLKYQERKGLLVIQLGDTIRADDYGKNVAIQRYQDFRKRALKEADEFIGKIIEQVDFKKDLLMVATPFPAMHGYNQKNLLTPFIMCGPNIQKGLTISSTTRRPGIIANIDIAPTILSFYGIKKPAVMLGHTVQSQQKKETLSFCLQTNKQLVSTFIQRAYLIKPYVGLQVFVSLGFLLLILFRKNWLIYIRSFVLAGITMPLVFLFLNEVAGNQLLSKYLWLLGLTAILVLIVSKFKDTLSVVIILNLVTALSIIFDLIWGAPLMQASVLGYDPIGGSRYYGLGNEYMGVLIGSLIIGLMAALDKFKANNLIYLVYILFIGTFYLILSPSYGSNVGGTISAFGAFLTTVFLLKGVKIQMKHIFLLAGGLVVSLAILFLVIAPLSPPSHISQTLEVVKVGGMKSVLIIIGRKLAMNYKLFKYTVWTRGLLTFLVVFIALLYKPPFILKRVFEKYKHLYSGIIGTGAGCFLALCFNDSGIVAAATMMIYITLPILLLVIDEV